MPSIHPTPGTGSKAPEYSGCPKHYPRYTTTNDTYAHGLYREILEDDEVESFLEETESYDSGQKRWSIPETLTRRGALVDALYSVLSSVMQRFVKIRESGVKRHLIDTQGHPECERKDENGYAVCPVLVVPATGPSFEIPQSSELAEVNVGYSCMATYFTVKLDSNAGSVDEQVHEMETYARQILRDQPNRLYTRSLILTENHARLVHFDRAGAEITPPFNIHQHPATFVRLVAGLCSPDERVLGIDTSIQWAIVNGRKKKGTITTTSPNGKPNTYPILGQVRTPRNEIRGRATTCWRVQDPDTLEELVVKDSWRLDDLRGEYELLELVKSTPGIVHMVSYETGRGETKDFRCPSTLGSFQNRVATRVTMKAYGRSIEYFTSVVQLLSAIRDAIAGHQRLVADDVRILHRDVAAQNVLLGKDGAPEGERGVLIDFDLAFRATDAKPTIEADHNTGVRIFQSLSVLSSKFMKRVPVHDHLDDLESFFLLLVYTMLLYRPDGSCLPSTEEGPSMLATWAEDDAELAWSNKRGILGLGRVRVRTGRLIEASWGPICGDLFQKFRAWTLSRTGDKQRLGFEGKGPEHLLPNRDEHYSQVLQMFDESIEAIRASTAPPPEPTLTDTRRPPLLPSHMATPLAVEASPPTPAPQLRRSARIRDQFDKKDHSLCPVVGASSSPKPLSMPEARRSARIQKRRLEEDDVTESPRPQAKRSRKSPRVGTRSR